MPKGRPPLEPRIKNLEELCHSLAGIIRFNEERIARLEGGSPQPKPVYQPQFDKWPGNGSPSQ
jgi:hypothetical protein